MRYGKVRQGEWLIEFRFNWREGKYDVLASRDGEEQNLRLGMVWKNPKKSRVTSVWEAFIHNDGGVEALPEDFEQMRYAGIALFDYVLSEGGGGSN